MVLIILTIAIAVGAVVAFVLGSTVVGIVLSCVGGAMLIALVAALVTYLMAFYSPQKGQNDSHKLLTGEQYDSKHDLMDSMVSNFETFPYEKVQTTSFDGLRLVGHYYHVADGAPLILCFHGYRGTATRDYCGGGPILIERGYNVLAVEQRAHGESGGHTITFGEKERLDCLSWAQFAVERFGPDVKIALYGVSMGATTVLLASELDLPANVLGIVADCPYSSPRDIVRKVCADKGLPPTIAYPFLWLGARVFGHFDPNRHSAVQSVKNVKLPILLIHGEADMLVPIEMSRQIAQSNPQIRYETFPDAAHGISYLEDLPRYKALVFRLLDDAFDTEQ